MKLILETGLLQESKKLSSSSVNITVEGVRCSKDAWFSAENHIEEDLTPKVNLSPSVLVAWRLG